MYLYSEENAECLFCDATCEPFSYDVDAEEGSSGAAGATADNHRNVWEVCSCLKKVPNNDDEDDDNLAVSLLSSPKSGSGNEKIRSKYYAFILVNLLDYPETRYSERLASRESACSGLFSVCNQCSKLVEEGHRIHHEIEILQEKLGLVKGTLKDCILTRDSGRGPGTSKVRKYIDKKLGFETLSSQPNPVKIKQEEISDDDDADAGVTDYASDRNSETETVRDVCAFKHEELMRNVFEDHPLASPDSESEAEAGTSTPVPVKRGRGRPRKNTRRSPRTKLPNPRNKDDQKDEDSNIDSGSDKQRSNKKMRHDSDFELHDPDNHQVMNTDSDSDTESESEADTSSRKNHFKCKICSTLYVTSHRLREHENLHKLTKGVFRCEQCPFVCKSNRALNIHMNKEHNDESLESETIKKKSKSTPKLKTTREDTSAEQSFACDRCPYVYATEPRLREHAALHDRDDVIKCEKCNYVCEFERAIKIHNTKFHEKNPSTSSGDVDNKEDQEKDNEKAIGNVGDAEFSEDSALQDNQSRKEKTTKLQKPKQISKDVLTGDGDNGNSFPCSKCPYVYATLHRLRQHAALHDRNEGDVIKCEKCNYVCEYERAIMIHNTKFHNEDEDTTSIKEDAQRTCQNIRKETSLKPEQTEYKCELCEAVYMTQHRLMEHKMLHNNPSALKCSHCPFVCRSKLYLIRHENKAHNNEALVHHRHRTMRLIKQLKRKNANRNRPPETFRCDYCSAVFNRIERFKEHVKRFHNNKILQCDGCELCFESKQLLDRHKISNCKKPTEGISNIEDSNEGNAESGHKETKQCEHCLASFKSSKNYYTHVSLYHSNGTFSCSYCSGSFPSETRLQYHLARSHADFHNVCKECGYKAHGAYGLNLHMQKHTKEKMAMCEICSKTFASPVYLNDHKRKEHYKELGVEPIRCKRCSEIFSSRSQLKYHVQEVHEKKFKYYCEHCGKGFLFKSKLHNHSITHTGEKNHICQYCGASYTSGRALVEHMRDHHPVEYAISKGIDPSTLPPPKLNIEGPFKCKYCEKEFPMRWNLHDHMKSHTEIFDKHKCSICGKGYKSVSGLKRHVETSHADNTYNCSYCGKQFSHKDYLRYHIKNNFCSGKRKLEEEQGSSSGSKS